MVGQASGEVGAGCGGGLSCSRNCIWSRGRRNNLYSSMVCIHGEILFHHEGTKNTKNNVYSRFKIGFSILRFFNWLNHVPAIACTRHRQLSRPDVCLDVTGSPAKKTATSPFTVKIPQSQFPASSLSPDGFTLLNNSIQYTKTKPLQVGLEYREIARIAGYERGTSFTATCCQQRVVCQPW